MPDTDVPAHLARPAFPTSPRIAHVSRFTHHSLWRRPWIAKSAAFALPLFLVAAYLFRRVRLIRPAHGVPH